MSRRLPDDAFEVYLRMGVERSYQAVADQFGVSKRAVARRAKAEGWQEQIQAVRLRADQRAGNEYEVAQVRQAQHLGSLREAIREVMTPPRLKALVTSMLRAAVQNGDMRAASLLLDRVLGKPRREPLPGLAIDLPDGLETAADVRIAANALLQGIAEGSVAPEDAQKAATVVEAARRSVETEDLERRLSELEESMKRPHG